MLMINEYNSLENVAHETSVINSPQGVEITNYEGEYVFQANEEEFHSENIDFLPLPHR